MSQRFMGSQTPSGWSPPPSGGWTEGMMGGRLTTSSADVGLNRLVCKPVLINQPITVDKLAVKVGTGMAGAKLVAGIYSSTEGTLSNGTPIRYPGALLGQVAEFSIATAALYEQTLVSPITLSPGISFCAFTYDTAGVKIHYETQTLPVLVDYSTSWFQYNAIWMSSTHAATMPDPAPTTGGVALINLMYTVLMRVV